jgi:hypothetical protein
MILELFFDLCSVYGGIGHHQVTQVIKAIEVGDFLKMDGHATVFCAYDPAAGFDTHGHFGVPEQDSRTAFRPNREGRIAREVYTCHAEVVQAALDGYRLAHCHLDIHMNTYTCEFTPICVLFHEQTFLARDAEISQKHSLITMYVLGQHDKTKQKMGQSVLASFLCLFLSAFPV